MEHCRLGSTGFSRIFGIRFPTPTPRACYLRSLGLVFGHSPPTRLGSEKNGITTKKNHNHRRQEGCNQNQNATTAWGWGEAQPKTANTEAMAGY